MAARDSGMDAWMNRYRSFAEGVVVMVSPVLLAFALTKVNLTQKEHGRVLPILMLVVAGLTLIAGICPFILCSFSKIWRSQDGRPQSPHTVTKFLATISSACLVIIACWIMSLIIYNNLVYPVTGALIGLCIVNRSVMMLFCGNDAQQGDGDSRLETTTEYLAGITAIVFVGLEGLALEAQINMDKGIQHRLTAPMATSFYTCVVGVVLMLLATIPPASGINTSILAFGFDVVMEFAVSLVMFFMMYAVMKLRALIVIVPGFLILLIYAFYIAISSRDNTIGDPDSNNTGAGSGVSGDSNNTGAGSGVSGSSNNAGTVNLEPAASLELTKVTFVGFLAVSIPSISNGSVNLNTEWFIHLAAAAIVSGLMWRLLTHLKSDEKVKAAVNFASICTHCCIVVAVIPFTIMARKALP